MSSNLFALVQVPEPFILVTGRKFDTPAAKWLDLTYTEAFRRLNLPFQIKLYPMKRCALMLNSGQVDGDVARVYSFGESYPHVVRVDVPVGWSSYASELC